MTRSTIIKRRLVLALLAMSIGVVGFPQWAPRVYAGGVVGNGTPGSCTEAALDTALAGGGDIAKTTCTVCHTFTAGGTSPNPLAPNLATYGKDGPFNDQLKALKASGDPDWLVKWVTNPPSVKPGTAMPPQGASAGGLLPDDSVKKVVEYILGLGK